MRTLRAAQPDTTALDRVVDALHRRDENAQRDIRTEFAEVLRQKYELCDEYAYLGKRHPINKELRDALYIAARQRLRKREQWFECQDIARARKLLGDEVVDPIFKALQEKASGISEEMRKRIEQHTTNLWMLAKDAIPVAGTERFLYDRHSQSTYRTVGLGAPTYARAKAYMDVLQVQLYGIPAHYEVETEKELNTPVVFNVYAHVKDRLEGELLHYKPVPWVDFEQWARLCWRFGVNPGVYVPDFSTKGVKCTHCEGTYGQHTEVCKMGRQHAERWKAPKAGEVQQRCSEHRLFGCVVCGGNRVQLPEDECFGCGDTRARHNGPGGCCTTRQGDKRLQVICTCPQFVEAP